MTREELQWAMYEAYAKELLARIEAQEAEIARLGTLAEQARADAVTRAAADEKRIEALRYERDKWKVAYDDRCALLDVIHSSLGIEKGDNVIGEIDRLQKARNGLLTQVQAERDKLLFECDALSKALAAEAELHAATALRMATDAAKLVERKHPVKAGEWVTNGQAARQVCKVFADWYLLSTGHDWKFDRCTPCDPPAADHDTPAGKDAAEAAIRNARKTEPAEGIKVGDVAEVFQATGDITAASDIGLRGTVIEIDSEDNSVRINSLAQNKEWVDMCDVRKVTT